MASQSVSTTDPGANVGESPRAKSSFPVVPAAQTDACAPSQEQLADRLRPWLRCCAGEDRAWPEKSVGPASDTDIPPIGSDHPRRQFSVGFGSATVPDTGPIHPSRRRRVHEFPRESACLSERTGEREEEYDAGPQSWGLDDAIYRVSTAVMSAEWMVHAGSKVLRFLAQHSLMYQLDALFKLLQTSFPDGRIASVEYNTAHDIEADGWVALEFVVQENEAHPVAERYSCFLSAVVEEDMPGFRDGLLKVRLDISEREE